tara:strand:+ start:709 stop:1044 length:336 start_codon:yes stop_codon:yes gene_type:complete
MKILIMLYIVVTATVYNAVPEQTNADCLTTASLKKIDSLNPSKHRWVAVSRDLEELGYTMGTKILVTGAGDLDGMWTVEDRMNKRWECRIDFLVNNDRIYGKWENVKITKL